eukprot:1715391-Amphidinium_carterae.1
MYKRIVQLSHTLTKLVQGLGSMCHAGRNIGFPSKWSIENMDSMTTQELRDEMDTLSQPLRIIL